MTKFNGKNMYVRNYSNENTVIYKAHKNKGHNPIKEDNILTKFCGEIMGDHDTTLYSYGTKNYECNIHLGRYLEELVQNIPNIVWPRKMKGLFFRMNNTRKIAISYGLKGFAKDKIKEYTDEFEKLLKLSKEENKKISSNYYKTKTKISGGFRSIKAANHYVNALSIIKTSIKRNINPYDSIKKNI